MRRRTAARGRVAVVPAALVLLVLGGLLLPGCAPHDARPEGARAIRVTPLDHAKGVGVRGPLRVSVADGRLVRVRVTRHVAPYGGDAKGARRGGAGKEAAYSSGKNGAHAERGQHVPGALTRGGRLWRPLGGSGEDAAQGAEQGAEQGVGRGELLAPGSSYTVDAVAVDGQGQHILRHTTFTTVPPAHRLVGTFTPEPGQPVGTGMIFSLAFNRPVADRAAVEHAVRVTADPSVRVAPHWFGRSRLDFRPRTYWRPGTRVTLALRLRGVRAAPGVYGVQRKRVGFTVGRDQRSVVDAGTDTMTVRRGGRVVRSLQVTAGAARTPTYSGRMVISAKSEETRMDARTVGFGGAYDIADVPHAMRLTNSGTFLHGNYWASARTFGSANVSHGCVGLPDVKGGGEDSPAGAFFHDSLIGDLVTVVNSGDRTVAPDNGLGGWNMGWREWRAGSARG